MTRLSLLTATVALLVACRATPEPEPELSSPAVAPGPAPAAPASLVAPTPSAPPATATPVTHAATSGPSLEPPPPTRRETVSDVFHGVTVSEDYRWLERDTEDAEVKAWTAAQNAHARRFLDALPHIAEIRARVSEVFGAETISWRALKVAGGHTFAIKRQPPKQHPFLVVTESLDGADDARVLVDPEALDPAGTTAIDWFVPSPDGALVAVSLSKAGTEAGDVHIFDTRTGARVHEIIPRVNGGTAGGALAWASDGSGFWYTRYPRGAERPEAERDFWVQIYFHRLGDATAADRYELGKGLPRIAEYQLTVDRRTARVLATVQNGDGGEFAHFVRDLKGTWRQLSAFGDKTLVAAFGPKGDLYIMSREGAPRGKILRVSGETLDLQAAQLIVPEGEDTIVEDFWGPPTVLPTESRLYLLYQRGGPSVISAFTLDGQPAPAPRQSPVSAVGGMTPLGGDDLLFWSRSFVAPTVYQRYAASDDETTPTSFAGELPLAIEGSTVTREMATSKDGTEVPVNIMRPPGAAAKGESACIVYGYGGYGVNLEPGYSVRRALFLEQGVTYIVVNTRGGGEYGEAWHRGGNLTHKQNVFDDFHAALEYVVDRGYCAKDRVGVLGGSNGGLLMGATLVQHPELPAAVASLVGIYDMLRVELSPNGAFNVPEFGTVKDEAQFKAMLAYSPYQNVEDGAAYPPTLLLTGDNDPRVAPLQSRKFTARLQAALRTSKEPLTPVLLRTSSDAGHGLDTKLDERVAQWSDIFAFYFYYLGVDFKPPHP